MKKRPLVLLAALAIAVAIAAGGYFALVSRTGMPRDPLLLAPPETAVIVRADMRALSRSALFQRLVLDRGLGADLAKLEEECGYNLLGSLAELQLFVIPESELSSRIAVVGAGRVDPDKAIACMKLRLEPNEVTLEETTLEGFRALSSPTIPTRVTFVGRRGVILGDEDVVVEILKRVRGEIPRIDPKSHLAKLYSRVSPRRELVVAAELPEDWHRQTQGFLSAEQAYHLMPTLMHLHEVGLGLSLKSGLSLGGVVVFEDEHEREAASERVERTLDNLRDNGFLSLTPAGALLRAIKLEHEGGEIRVGVELTEEQVEGLLKMIGALGQEGAFIKP